MIPAYQQLGVISFAGIILCMRPANERRRYNVTSSPIGWAHAQNDRCICLRNDWILLLCLSYAMATFLSSFRRSD